jgi:hypothetical protein
MSLEDRVAARINFGGSTHAPVTVSVLDPEKIADGTVTSHIVFTVRCVAASSFGDWTAGVTSVKRRFRDFVWLDGALGDAFPGAIRPPLPKSSLIGGVNLFERRRLLEVFMVRVLCHPELSFAKAVQMFCCCSDADDDAGSSSNPSSLPSPFAEFMAAHKAETVGGNLTAPQPPSSSPTAATASTTTPLADSSGGCIIVPSGAELDAMMMGMLSKLVR